MSASNNPQDFPAEEEEIVKLCNSAQPESDDSVPGQEIAPESEISVREKEINIGASGDHQKELLLEEIIQKKEIEDEATGSSRNPENPIAENDDGFKTPTSPDHKIPSSTQCPPAPRKPRPPKLKRKASPPAARRSLQFDEPAEVESIFRPVPDQDNVEEMKNKKARQAEED